MFVLFRRKWFIVLFLLLGLAGAVYVWFSPRTYSSSAKLILRYIKEEQEVLPIGEDNQIREIDPRGDSIINTELQILTSWDIALQTAQRVGPNRVLGVELDDGVDGLNTAGQVIVEGLDVDVPNNANAIRIRFRHKDPEVCRAVLAELIDRYLELHEKIHTAGVTYDELAKQTDEMKLRLRQTEDELLELRNQAGGVSIEEAKQTCAVEIQTIRAELLQAEGQLAVWDAAIGGGAVSSSNTTSEASSEDVSASPAGDTNVASEAPLRAAFEAKLARLRSLKAREEEYLSRFTDQNPLVRSVRAQIEEVEEQVNELVAANPGYAFDPSLSGEIPTEAGVPVTGSPEQIAALRARIQFLNKQLKAVRDEALRLSGLERSMAALQLNKAIQEESLRQLVPTLERERFDSALESGRLSNINIAQAPSPPVSDSNLARKNAGMVFAFFVGAGIALALLFELFVDPRVKRPADIERKLQKPVTIALPFVKRRRVSGNGVAKRNGQAPAADGLRPYFEALRDRLVFYFERVNLRRKPKLIGVAGCHGGAGVSSVAEGLASTLSETGGGKVLLVDMNDRESSAHPYSMGRPALKLQDVLDGNGGESSEDSGSNAGGLSLAALGGSSGRHHPARSREFDQLIPRLKSSQLDYIVFDLPPLTETSVSYRLAGFLDKCLVVVEAEKTHYDSVNRAFARLADSQVGVSLVLNKTQEYLPSLLRPPQ